MISSLGRFRKLHRIYQKRILAPAFRVMARYLGLCLVFANTGAAVSFFQPAAVAARSTWLRPARAAPSALRAAVSVAPPVVNEVPSVDSSPAEPPPASATKRSVLVMGWFYATPRELAFVKRLYKRNGAPRHA